MGKEIGSDQVLTFCLTIQVHCTLMQIASTSSGRIRKVIVSQRYDYREAHILFEFGDSVFNDFFKTVESLAKRRIIVCPAITIINDEKRSDSAKFVDNKLDLDSTTLQEVVSKQFESGWLNYVGSNDKDESLNRYVQYANVSVQVLDTSTNSLPGRSVFRWPQDFYIRFESGSSSQPILHPFVCPSDVPIGNYHQLRANNCIPSSNTFRLQIGSGNLHVQEQIVFVGETLFKHGYNLTDFVSEKHEKLTKERLENIGVLSITETNNDEIFAKISKQFGENVKLIRVGMEEGGELFTTDQELQDYIGGGYFNNLKSYQPLYHIDLFFHPGKTFTNGQSNFLLYFIAEPHERWQSSTNLLDNHYKHKLKLLQSQLNDTKKYIEWQLLQSEIIAIPISVPMNVYRFGECTSFLNGLVHGKSFMMPDYSGLTKKWESSNAKENLDRYYEARTFAKRQLSIVFESIIDVKSEGFTTKDALKCQSFVYDRETN